MMNPFANLPPVLIAYRQWVNYLLFSKADGKLTKLPVNPTTGRYASVSDPATWSSFDAALARLQNDPRLHGLGFVFSEADPFTGIDFDHCRDPQTGAIHPGVHQWLTLLDSYSEVSVSGSGIHVLVKAILTHSGCRKNGIEVYDRRRFFVVTGQHLEGTPITIENRQTQVETLHGTLFPPVEPAVPPSPKSMRSRSNDDLIQQIARSPQGSKFLRLLDGNWSGYHSQSEADLALCSILAAWTSENTQVDAIFRSSGLYRKKWDETHHHTGLTYGQMTLSKARS